MGYYVKQILKSMFRPLTAVVCQRLEKLFRLAMVDTLDEVRTMLLDVLSEVYRLQNEVTELKDEINSLKQGHDNHYSHQS